MASNPVHPFACHCDRCDVEPIGDPTLPLRMTLTGALIGGVIVAMSETIRNFDAIAAAVLP